MFRKTMVALAAIVTLSMVNIASSPTDARGGFHRYRHPRYYGYVYANPVAYVGYPTAHFFGYPSTTGVSTATVAIIAEPPARAPSIGSH
jgi:hypothetical protein